MLLKSTTFVLFILVHFSNYASDIETVKKFDSQFDAIFKFIKTNDTTKGKSISYLEGILKEYKTADLYYLNGVKLLLAKSYRSNNMNKTLALLKEVEQFLKRNPNQIHLLLFYNTIVARIEFESNTNCQYALELYEKNMQHIENYKTFDETWNIALETKTGLINTTLCLGNEQEALELLKELEKEINPSIQKDEYVYVVSLLGYIHTKFQNYTEGEKNFEKIIKLLENTNDNFNSYFGAINNLAYIYRKTANNSKAYTMLNNALKKAKKQKLINETLFISNNLGFVCVELDSLNQAENLGNQVLQNSDSKTYAFHNANARRLLGLVHYHMGNYKLSINYVDSAITFFRKFKNIELLRSSLDIKNKILLKNGEYEEAAKINAEIIGMLDSISLSSNFQNLQKSLIEYETEKKEKEITILKQKDEISNYKINQQKLSIKLLIAGIFLLGVIAGIIIFFQRKINSMQTLTLRSKLTRSQFNPHYINNAFTSLQAKLTEIEFDESLINYTSNISRFSRLVLESSFNDEWTVYEEVQMMDNYLKIQQYRYKKAFLFSIDNQIPIEKSHTFLVPTAITQTVLENAIEHGGGFDR